MENKEDMITDIKKKITTMEWDKKHHQLNFALEGMLVKYKKELLLMEGKAA